MGRYTNPALVSGRYKAAAMPGNDMESYFITGAEAQLDGVLAKRFYNYMPFTPAVPPYLVDLATDMTYLRIKPFDKTSAELASSIKSRLDALYNGTVELVNVDGTILTDVSNFSYAENTYRSRFGPDDPTNWSVSSSQQEDAQTERIGD